MIPDDLRCRCQAPLPHPDDRTLRALASLTADWALHHHATLSHQPLGRSPGRAELEALLREPPPEDPRPFEAVLRRFSTEIAANALRPNHPRFLAFIPSAPTFVSILGDWLCAATNFFAGVWLEAAGPAQIELVVLDWFRDFLGLPPGTAGILTSGGSEANLTALVVARQRLAAQDRHRAVLYVCAQRHWSIDRAAHIAGLLPHQLRPVPVDGQLRLSVSDLARCVVHDRSAGLFPWAVAANAGSTNTGAIDPLAELAELCSRENLWLHVDAAYGWAVCLTSQGQALLRGIERADSVTLDPHKWLAQPFEVGGLLVRDGQRLREAFAMRPEYMQDVEPASDEVNFADHGLALSRRFRALKVWLSIQVHGLGWFRRLIEHCIDLARYAEHGLAEAGFEIASPAQLGIVCFRQVAPSLGPEEADRLNLDLVQRLRASEEAFLSSTRLQGRVALRFCFVNWRTTADDVDRVITLLCAALAELRTE